MASTFLPNRKLRLLLVGAIAFGIACIYTWPLILDPFNLNYDGSGHTPQYTWLIWWRKYSFLNGLDYNFLSLSEYPFGAAYARRGEYPLLMSGLAVIAYFTNELFAYNVAILGAFVLSSVLMFVLTQRYLQSFWLSLFSALAFAFSNYAIAHSRVHINLPQQWLVILGMLVLFLNRQRRTWVSAATLGLMLGATLLMTPYYAFQLVIITALFATCEVVQFWSQRNFDGFKTAMMGYVLAAVLSGIVSWPILNHSVLNLTGTYENDPIWFGENVFRDTDHLFFFSSRPWDFVLPSQRHPIVGEQVGEIYSQIRGTTRLDFTSPRFEERYPNIYVYWYWQGADVNGRETYLGLINLSFAGLGLWLFWRKRNSFVASVRPDVWATHQFELTFLLLLFVVALSFTMPPLLPLGALLRVVHPALHEFYIPTPSLFVMEAGLPFREANRFVVSMMIPLVIWAALGMQFVAQRLRTQPLRRIFIALCFVVLGLEYAQTLKVRSFSPTESEVHQQSFMDANPNAVLGNTDGSGQRFSQSPTILGNTQDTQDNHNNYWYLVQEVMLPERPGYAAKLKALTVTHVFGDEAMGQTKGLSVASIEGDSYIYELTAKPAKLFVTHTPGRTRDSWQSDTTWAWDAATAEVYIWNTTSGPIMFDVTATLSNSNDAALSLYRELSPWHETALRSGLQIDNPIQREHYDPEPIVATAEQSEVRFDSLLIQPGETTLTFEWIGEDYPTVENLSLQMQGTVDASN